MKPSRLISIFIAGILVVAEAPGRLRAEDSTVQIRKTMVSEAVAQLSTLELIDRLQNEAGEKIDLGQGSFSVRFAALEHGFLPVDAPAFAVERNLRRYPASPVMAELVARGIASLPLLLEHLSDARPTRCAQIVQFGFGGPGGFADKYDSRYREPDRQPKEVNLMTVEKFKAFKTEHYVLRVGDLCYYAVGQIVNRRLEPVSNGLGHNNRALTINSPVENATLATAARAEWRGLTAAEHEAILRTDAQADENWPPPVSGEPAIKRLLYYYPAAGKSETERRLAAELDPKNLGFREWLVYELGAFDWPGLHIALRGLFERAKAIQVDNEMQRFFRDQLVLTVVQKLGQPGTDQAIRSFLADEVTWWDNWGKQVADPNFQNSNKVALTNLARNGRDWSIAASAFLNSETAKP